MKNVSEWNTFMKSGRVEDYLRYTESLAKQSDGREEINVSERMPVTEGFYAKSCNSVRNDNQIRADKRI